MDGRVCDAVSGDEFVVDNPATGRALARVAAGGAADIDRAVLSARAAYEEDWRLRPPRERGKLLLEAARHIRAHAEEIALIETLEMGKPLDQSLNFDLRLTPEIFEYFAGLADKIHGDYHLQGWVNAYTIPEPYGVVGAIIPFNWPPTHVAGKCAPALAAGNTIVLKPAEQAPLAALRTAELLQDILPPGVVNVVPGLGAAAGASLVSHPLVGKISFTGSGKTGIDVLHGAADRLTHTLLELGGKSPLIVFPDADFEIALRGAIEGMFFNQGEACSAASRILLHRSIAEEFSERFCRAAERLRVGDGLDPATDLGPLVTRAQQQRVREYLELAECEGAQVLARGKLPEDPTLADGFFVPPIVLGNVRLGSRIDQEEIFGPVAALYTFDDYDEAIRVANGTSFGLVAGVFTRDLETAQRAARDLETGVVMINNYNRGLLGSPFGGMKASGFGREHALETIREYTRTKNVRLPSGFGDAPLWTPADRVLREP